MPISHSNNVIFIHIPKTAGTSIERALGVFGGICERRLFGLDMQHMSASDIKHRFPTEWKTYYKFAFVREPLDRIISEHSWRMKATNVNSSFDAFVIYTLRNIDILDGSLRVHILPQASFLDEDIDLIGRFEALNPYWEEVKNAAGISSDLAHHNKSKITDQPKLSRQAASYLLEIYCEDFDRFGYKPVDISSLPESELLKEIEVASSSLENARSLLQKYKSEKKYFESALLAQELRDRYSNKPIGWIMGIESCIFMDEFGMGSALIEDATTRFHDLLVHRLSHSLARKMNDSELTLRLAKEMVERWPEVEDCHVRLMQDLVKLGYVNQHKYAKHLLAFLDNDYQSPTSLRARRGIYLSQNRFDHALEISMQLVESGENPSALLSAIDDLAQLSVDNPNWSRVEKKVHADLIPPDIYYRVMERLHYIQQENIANAFESHPAAEPDDLHGPIHLLWIQGEDYAPKTVKLCISQWRKLNKDVDVIVHDGRDVENLLSNMPYLNVSDIPHAAVSDIFRTAVLQKHGGVWADATLYPVWPIKMIYKWLGKPDFFTFDGLTPEKHTDSWFIISKADNECMTAILNKVTDYWKVDRVPFSIENVEPKFHYLSALSRSEAAALVNETEGQFSDKFPYFWWHYLFNSLVEKNPLFRATYANRNIRPSPMHAHRLQFYLRRSPQPSLSRIKSILNDFPLHKLSHRHDGCPGMDSGIEILHKLSGSAAIPGQFPS